MSDPRDSESGRSSGTAPMDLVSSDTGSLSLRHARSDIITQRDIQEILITGALNRLDEMEDDFYCPDKVIYSPADIPCPNFEVKPKVGTLNRFTVEVTPPRPQHSRAQRSVHSYLSDSISNRSFEPDIRRADRLPHSTTFKMISFRERTLSHIRALDDVNDSLTPDYIQRRGNSLLVMEYGTFGHNISSAHRAYEEKIDKYSGPICARKTCRTAYYVILVTQTNVISNHPLMTDAIASILIMLYRFSRAICREMYRINNVREPDEVLKQSLEKWDQHFGEIRPFFDGSETIMNEDFYHLCQRVCDGQHISNLTECETNLTAAYSRARTKIMSYGLSENTHEEKVREHYEIARQKIDDFLKDDPRGFELRSDPKCLTIHPFILMRPYPANSAHAFTLNHPDDLMEMSWGDLEISPVSRLWSKVLSEVANFKIKETLDETLLEDIFLSENKSREELLQLAKDKKMYRSKYHRVTPRISEDDAVLLACSGLKAKRLKDNHMVKRAKLMGKRRFSVNTPTNDIDKFVRTAAPYLTTKITHPCTNEVVMSLMRRSLGMHAGDNQELKKASDDLIREVKDFSQTRLGVATKIIGEIAHEVAISMRQYCKPKDFVIKRLSYYPIWLLIVSHGVGLPVFYSLFFFNADLIEPEIPEHFHTIFRKIHTNGTSSWTDFVSMVEPKLINPVKAFEQSMVYYRSFQSIGNMSMSETPMSGVHGSHFCMNILLYFHNRQSACDAATTVRYIFMESNVSYPRIPEPTKMLEKYTANPLSRLEVYLNYRITQYMLHIHLHPVERDSEGEFSHFSSWLTLEPLERARQCVNYCYQGYTANKQKHLEPHNLSSVCDSVTEKEVEYQGNLRRPEGLLGHGHGEVPLQDLKFSEFQRSTYMRAVELMVRHHERQRGPNWRHELFKEYVMSLTSLSMESLATLKATSKVDASWRVIRDDVYKREKILTEIYRLSRMADTTEVLGIAVESMKIMQEEKFMYICIFPKDQIAGIREIYVLRLESRMCQKLVERFSEIMCEYMPNEIITHPENKFKVIHAHKEKTAMYHNKVTLGTSADKKKWNHGHTAAKFMLGLSRFVEPCMLDFFFSTLQMWERRRIMAPQKLTNIVRAFDNLNTTSESVQHLHRALVRHEDTILCDADSPMFKIQHGFMQGILHFTSSAEHGRFLMLFTNFARAVIYKMKAERKLWPKTKFFIDTMYSSDDSGLLMTLTDDGTETMRRSHKALLALIGESMRDMGVLLGMYESPKSTFHTEDRLEFNSRFMFGSSIEEPILRQVNSAVHVSNCESIIGQLEEGYGILEGILENGGEFWLLSHIQAAQCIFHYRLMGSEVNRFFRHHYDFLMDVPDPSLGFFPMDNPLCTSVLGMRYNYWILSHEKSISSRYKFLLSVAHHGSKHESMALGLSNQSAILGSTAVVFSNREKARQAFEKSGLPVDWPDILERNAHLMLCDTLNPQVVYAKLAAKMHQSGVITKYGSSTSNELQPLRAAVYKIHRPCMSDHDYDLMMTDDEWGKHKTSLILEQRNYIRYADVRLFSLMIHQEDKFLSDNDRLVIFPSARGYSRIRQSLDAFSSRRFTEPTGRDDRKRSKLVILERSSDVAVSLRRVCEITWGIKAGNQNEVHSCRLAFSYYAARFPWLSSTLEETALKCPFPDKRSLMNFIMQYKHDTRVLQVSTPPIRTTYGQSGLMEIIRINYVQRKHLCFRDENTGSSRVVQANVQQTFHELYCLLLSPFNSWFKTVCAISLLNQIPDLPFERAQMDSRMNRCAILQDFAVIKSYIQHDDPTERDHLQDRMRDMSQRLEMLKPSIMGVWSTRQRREGRIWTGPGVWEGRLLGYPVRIEVSEAFSRTTLDSVTTTSVVNIHEILPVLRSWMRENKVFLPASIQGMGEHSRRTNSSHFDRNGMYHWIINPDLDIGLLGSTSRMIHENLQAFRIMSMEDRIKLLYEESTVISLPTKPTDYDNTLHRKRFFMNNWNPSIMTVLHNWMYNRPLRLSDLIALASCDNADIVLSGRLNSYEKYRKWLDDALQECVNKSGHLPERLMPAVDALINAGEDDYDDEPWTEVEDALEDLQDIHFHENAEPEVDADYQLVSQVMDQYTSAHGRNISSLLHGLLDEHFDCRRHWHDVVLKRIYCITSEEEVELASALSKAYKYRSVAQWRKGTLHRRVRLDVSEPDAPVEPEIQRAPSYVPERYNLDDE